MFYTEEDVLPYVVEVEKVFGKSGEMDVGKNVLYNVAIATREFGKIWYGDLTTFDLADKLKSLETALNTKLFVISADGVDFNTAMSIK